MLLMLAQLACGLTMMTTAPIVTNLLSNPASRFVSQTTETNIPAFERKETSLYQSDIIKAIENEVIDDVIAEFVETLLYARVTHAGL
jgi:hypothetical protein